MKKALLLILSAILLTSCTTPPQQLTATAEAIQAQTQTAAPTATFTTTPSPTIPPSPTVTSTPELVVVEVSGLRLDTLYHTEDPGFSFQYPSSWDIVDAAEMGSSQNEVMVTDDFEKASQDLMNLTFSSINFRIVKLEQPAPANEVVNQFSCNPDGKPLTTSSEVIHEQDFFWGECEGFIRVDGHPLIFLFTGITNGHTSAVASTMINASKKEEIQPIYDAIVRTIILSQE